MTTLSAPGRCENCGSPDLLTVELSVGDQPVSFTACHECETKWWVRAGARIPLRSVLEVAAQC